jgi:hypothetical protein
VLTAEDLYAMMAYLKDARTAQITTSTPRTICQSRQSFLWQRGLPVRSLHLEQFHEDMNGVMACSSHSCWTQVQVMGLLGTAMGVGGSRVATVGERKA